MLVRIFNAAAFRLLISAAALTSPAAAQKIIHRNVSAAANFPDDSISIVTQAAPGRDAGHIAELARAYAETDALRLLPVTGLGPIANTRDLLHMRGIDFAVLDADIRAYSRYEAGLQGAETRLTQVLKLYDKVVYIVAAADVRTVADLAGQKVLTLGEDSDGHVTARALFGLLNISITLVSSDLAAAKTQLIGGSAKAVVLVAPEGENPLTVLPADKNLHVLSVPANIAVDTVYRRAILPKSLVSGFAATEAVQTVRVAALLTTYTWRPNLYRYGPVQQFVRALPAAIAQLRSASDNQFWRSVDAQADVPDWQIYDAARPVLASIAPAVAAPASTLPAPALVRADAAEVTASITHSAPASIQPPVISIAGGIVLIASTLPGLTDPEAADGGLLAELAVQSLPGDKVRLDWAPDAQAAARRIESLSGARLGLAWRRPDCTGADTLTADDKALCDRFLFSAPLFQALDVFFVRRGSDFTFERDDQVAGRSVCVAASADVSALDGRGRNWLKQDLLTLLHRPTIAACLAALDKGDVDAVFSDEMAGSAVLEQAGLASRIQLVDRAAGVRELSAIAAKSDPAAANILSRLAAGLTALKADGRYSTLIMKKMRKLEVSAGEQIVK